MRYHQLIITAPGRLTAPLINLAMQHGSLGVIERIDGFTAYFPYPTDISSFTNELSLLGALLERSSAGGSILLEHTEIPDHDWNESWKKSFKPIRVGKHFSVLPPWERPHKGRIPLYIDPGMAFGTGHHETTRSCLALMEKYAVTMPRTRFLDLGTGTGLLAIAARRLGFKNVLAIDTDPLSIKAARTNLKLNRVTGIVLRKSEINALKTTFGMIAANLMAGTLIELAQAIAERTSPAGIVIMSGILKGQDKEVVAAAKNAGLVVRERLRDGKWVSLVLQRQVQDASCVSRPSAIRKIRSARKASLSL